MHILRRSPQVGRPSQMPQAQQCIDEIMQEVRVVVIIGVLLESSLVLNRIIIICVKIIVRIIKTNL